MTRKPRSDPELHALEAADLEAAAGLVHRSFAGWYRCRGLEPTLEGSPEAVLEVCRQYAELDPGCAVVAGDPETGSLLGVAFYHPRETHVSIGPMAVEPEAFGKGVGRRLLEYITGLADARELPTRLLSSTLNLDSFSLYSRGGFLPRGVFQGMTLDVPAAGLPAITSSLESGWRVRDAAAEEARALADLERDLGAIRREKDLRFLLGRPRGAWRVAVLEDSGGGRAGFLAIAHSGEPRLVGPGVARDAAGAAALLHHVLGGVAGRTCLLHAPADGEELVAELYRWGARNRELQFLQVRGPYAPPSGVILPSLFPESG